MEVVSRYLSNAVDLNNFLYYKNHSNIIYYYICIKIVFFYNFIISLECYRSGSYYIIYLMTICREYNPAGNMDSSTLAKIKYKRNNIKIIIFIKF